jgi:hypothetical protein
VKNPEMALSGGWGICRFLGFGGRFSCEWGERDLSESRVVIPSPVTRWRGRDATEEAFSHGDLFRTRLDQIVNMRHELVQLAERIDWDWLDAEIAPHSASAAGSSILSTPPPLRPLISFARGRWPENAA